MARPIRIAILANASKANSEVDSFGKKFGGVMSKIGKTGAAGVAIGLGVAAAAAVSFGKSAVSAASDAQQSMGATETVFGKAADTIIRKSKRAATQVGLSANAYRENANLIGSLFANKGLKGNELAKQTDLVVRKGADLAATFGGTTKDAVEALSAAFKGEFDPIERYGISIKQSTINTEAASLAHKQYGKDLKYLTAGQQNAIQRQATMNLLNQQSAKSTGAFARETDTLAHQQQVLGAKFENVKAKIGTALLPVVTQFVSWVSDKALPVLSRWGSVAADYLGPALQKFGGFLSGTVVPAVQKLGTWVGQTVVPAFQKMAQKAGESGGMLDTLKTYAAIAFGLLRDVAIPILKNLAQVYFPLLAKYMTGVVIPAVTGVVKAILNLANIGVKALGWILHGAAEAFGWVPGIGPKLKVADAKFGAFASSVQTQLDKLNGLGQKARDQANSVGRNWGKGMKDGILAEAQGAEDAAGFLVNAMNARAKHEADIHSPSRKAKKIGTDWVAGLVIGLTSGKDAVAGTGADLISGLQDKIGGLLKGKRQARALSIIKAYAPQVRALGKAYDAVTSKLDTWNQKLADAQQKYDDLKSSVADSVTGMFTPFANLLDVASTGSIAGNIAASASAQVAGIRNLIGKLNALRSKGAPQALLMQILGMGADQGARVADALLGAPDVLRDVSSAFTDVAKLSGDFGKQMADQFYGNGVNIAKGMIQGLQSQQAKLERQMTRLGEAIVNAIKKKLGIKSPSRVMRSIAKYTVQGFTLEVDRQQGVVQKTMGALANTVTGAFGSPKLTADAVLGAGASGGNVYHLSVNVPPTANPAEVGRHIVSAIDAYERSGGRRRAS